MSFKQLKIKNLSGGRGAIEQDDQNLVKFSESKNIVTDDKTNQITLSTLFESQSIPDSDLTYEVSFNNPMLAFNYSDNILACIGDYSSGEPYIYSIKDNNSPVFIDNLDGISSPLANVQAFFRWGGIGLINHEYKLYYSLNPFSSSYDWIEITDISYLDLYAYCDDGDRIYVIGVDSDDYINIYSSLDGKSWTLEYISDRITYELNYDCFLYFEGFFYVLLTPYSNGDTSSKHILLRFNSDFTESQNIRTFGSVGSVSTSIKVFDNLLFLMFQTDNDVLLYSYDGDQFTLIDSIPNTISINGVDVALSYPRLQLATSNKLYFSIATDVNSGNSSFLFSYDGSGVFLEHENSTNYIRQVIEGVSGVIYILTFNFSGSSPRAATMYNNYNKKNELSGFVESSIYDFGTHQPRHLILKHPPLPANTTIKVYADIDRSGSFGSAVITQDVDDSIRSEFSFDPGNSCDFIQFKIELISTSNTLKPSDVQLIYGYTPVGLQNRK